MKANETTSKLMLISSMCIFGTIGIFRRYIPLPSSLVALIRGVIGTAFLFGVIFLRSQKMDRAAVKRYFPLLLLSGCAIGFNWILLFEAYNYTSVAIATLCYYLAPIIVILASPPVLKEKLTLRHCLCALAALAGMIPVSGILDTGFSGIQELKGIFYGIAAAALYASVILMNKKMPEIPSFDKTVFQLLFASVCLVPYVTFTVDLSSLPLTPIAVILLLTIGIVHTGLAYWMYFGSMSALNAHTVALLSYIDPILAIILSAVLLHEPMGIATMVGAAVILGAAYLSEK